MKDKLPERDLKKLADLHDHANMAQVISRVPEQIDIGLAENSPKSRKDPSVG